jgi:DNA gyrase subunit B
VENTNDGDLSIEIEKKLNGVMSPLEPLNKHFFSSDSYLDLMSLELNKYSNSSFVYKNNDGVESAPYTLTECFDKLIAISKNSITLQRYKGLGEMNPPQLEETTMNPKSRTLIKVLPLEDGNQVVVELMGDDVEMRKQFIKQEYSSVKNLDI